MANDVQDISENMWVHFSPLNTLELFRNYFDIGALKNHNVAMGKLVHIHGELKHIQDMDSVHRYLQGINNHTNDEVSKLLASCWLIFWLHQSKSDGI